MGCFSSVIVRKRLVVGYHSGTLMCANLYGDMELDMGTGERVIYVSGLGSTRTLYISRVM